MNGAGHALGVFGGGYDLNGSSSYLRVLTSNALFPATNAITIEARIFPRSTATDQFVWDI